MFVINTVCCDHILDIYIIPESYRAWVDCYVSTGGYIERVLATSPGTSSSHVSKYLKTCKDTGFDVLELSSGFLSIPTEDWALLVEETKKAGLKPKPEVGIQCVPGPCSRAANRF